MDEKTRELAELKNSLDTELAIIVDGGDEVSNAAKRLSEKRKAEQLLTTETKELSLDFLSAKPDKLRTLLTKFPEFCRICQESKTTRASDIIEAMVDRYVGDYDIDCDTLTYIGIHLNKNNYKKDAIRCFNKAENLISK